MWNQKRPQVVSALADAAAEGDRSENAEYIYRKRQLAEIDRRLRFLGRRLDALTVVTEKPRADGRVYFGCYVTVEDEDGQEKRYRIVGPDEWDVEWPTETAQEIGFRADVLARVEADGYRPELLSLAWMEFKEPKPRIKVEQFVELGAEKVFYFSAAISADAMHSQYDIPALVEEADVPEGYPLINLGAWNDDPIVIAAIKAKIDTLMESK